MSIAALALMPAPTLEAGSQYVTVMAGGETFGLPIERVNDVFVPTALTPVPLAPAQVAGLVNLRGRVVTALSLRALLGLPSAAGEGRSMAVGIDHRGEAYGLLVDSVGEVLTLARTSLDPSPAHLDPRWKTLSRGVHRLDDLLLVILDLDALLSLELGARAPDPLGAHP